ncbi:asparaginase [Chryseosolibacter indicus]|uniref:asparaginase n=1 Tax=Chryseosolibacter indicus TaxID=2782351 RepID=A0ABS5VWA1_9BACT|nr:asparaginase [Chryseosolibacter indicus]MBT1705506.1 asparaginase [Chryseosolibacter indicus]
MNLKRVSINTALPQKPKGRILIIYTGGTFGMTYDNEGVLIPFDFSLILEHLPTLKTLALELTVVSFETPIDSSNMIPEHWQVLAKIIYQNYETHDGFVVLHGTDTMAYTASALSFMLEGLSKPVIFTGAQLPITEARSDARENLITALDFASAVKDGRPQVPEVCIYFDYELLRGNRSKKVESMQFDAFDSGNYPPLAKAGVKMDYNYSLIRSVPSNTKLNLRTNIEPNVAIVKLFPGLQPSIIESIILSPGLKAVILETYGSGNAPTSEPLLNALKRAIDKGIIVLNISQCSGGMVTQGRYETSRELLRIGVIGGADMTTEAAVTKLMLLMGEYGTEKAKQLLPLSLAGELTES